MCSFQTSSGLLQAEEALSSPCSSLALQKARSQQTQTGRDLQHGRRSRGIQGGHVPPEFGAGDANANYPPPQILSYRYKNERSVFFKIRQNPFSAGALPWTPLGELTTLPRPLSRLERGHPSPYLAPLGMDPPSALAMRPPEIQPDLRL